MASETWLFGATGDWSTAADWVTGTVPTSADDASLNSVPSGAATITGSADANSLTLNAAYLTDSGTLTLGTGLTLTNNSYLYLNGGVVVAPSGVSLNGGYIYNSGGSSSITGDVAITGYGDVQVSAGSLTVSGSLADGVTYVNSGATLTVGGSLADYNTYVLYGATLTVGGSLTESGSYNGIYVYADATLTVDGSLTESGSYGGIYVSSGGTVRVGGTLALDYVSLGSGASLEIGGGSASQVTFGDFAGSGTLKLDAPAAFTGQITGAGLGTTLDLAGVAVSAVSYSGSTLTVTEANNQQLTFSVAGNLTGDAATFGSDGHGGTDINWVQQGETWKFGATGDWSTAADWVTGTVPTSADDASLNSVPSGAATITGSADANSLTLNAAYLTDSGTLTLGTGLTLTNNSYLYLNGGVVVAPSGVSLNGGYIYNSGGSSSITGDVAITGYGDVQVSAGSLTVSGSLADGVTYVNSGATLTVGGSLADYNTYVLYGATLTVGGSLTESGSYNGIYVYADATLTVDGSLTESGSYGGIYVSSGGTVRVGGTLALDYVSLGSGASLEIGGGSASQVTFGDFAGSGTLKLDAPAAFTGQITGAGLGTTLDLAGVAVSAVSYSGSTLTVTEANNQQLTFSVAGNLTGDAATFGSDGHGGTDINWVQQGETWKFGATGDWSTAADWVTGTVPTSADDASLNSVPSGAATITGSADANSLTLNAAYLTDSGTLTLGTGLTLTNNSYLYLNGGVVVAPSGVSLNGGYIYNSGGSSSITGDVAITGYGDVQVSAGSLTVSGSLADGVTYVNSGATLTVGGSLADYNTYVLYGATLTVGGSLTESGSYNGIYVYADATLTVDGSLTESGSYGGIYVSSGGTVRVGGTLALDYVSLGSGASLEIGGGSASQVTFGDFAGSGTLKLDAPAAFTGQITGAGLGTTLDLAGVAVSAVSYSGSTLTVTEANNQQLTFSVAGNLTGDAATFGSDGHGGTDINWVQTPLAVTSVSVAADNGATSLDAGRVVTITLGTSEPTIVSGAPALQLSNGAEAVYMSGAGTDSLTFSYTVQAGQDTPDLLTAGLTGGAITDQAGHPLGGLANQDLRLAIDTTRPTVTITSSGGLTNQASQTIGGTVSDAQGDALGTTVYLYDNGSTTPIGSATVQADGSWSAPVTLTGDGPHSIVATDTDQAGNLGQSAALGFTLDTTPQAAPPTITGTGAGQTTTSEAPVDPFSGVTVGDANVGATDTLTITLSNGGAGGTLADGTGFSGLVLNGSGVYTLSGTASAITSELDALVFTPTAGQPNTTTTTTFTLSDVSSAYGTTSYGPAQTLLSFDGSNGLNPYARLLSDSNGDLFGTTIGGGDYGRGAVFEIPKTSSGYDPAQTLYSWVAPGGGSPYGGLISDSNGDLFGTSSSGGQYSWGTVFEIHKTSSDFGASETLLTFGYDNGGDPRAGLISDSNGDLFGTTSEGGALEGGGYGYGTVFEIPKTSSGYGPAQTLLTFDGSNGSSPRAGLLSDGAGDLFGTTAHGGAYGYGTVFEIPKASNGYGPAQTLWSFNAADGTDPEGDLITDGYGNLFGTTVQGGTYNSGTVFEIPKTGSGYGPAQTLWSFNAADGAFVYGGLIRDGNGDLFGTTIQGGANGYGTVFEIPKTSSGYGPVQTLLSFDGSNGAGPFGGLISDGAGDLFGTTIGGGANGDGTVFEIADVFTPIPTVDSTTTVTNSDPADTTPPAQPAIAAASYSGGAWTLSGSAEALSTVTVYDGATALGTMTADSGGAWSFPTGESNSAIRAFSVTATDAAGNTSIASAAELVGTPGADTFSFASEAALAAPAAILGDGGSDKIRMTAAASLLDADFANAHAVLTLTLTGASTVTLGADAAAAGIGKVTTGKGATGIADGNTGTLKVDATTLAAGSLLTLSGSEKFLVTGLQGNLAATNVTGALNVTTVATAALSIATGNGSDTFNASAMMEGETLTLTGSHAATVTVGGDLATGAYAGKLTVTASGTTSHAITTGAGKDSITATNGGDTIAAGGAADTITVSGHSIADSFVYKAASDSLNMAAGHDTITGFSAGTGTGAVNDTLDVSAILGPTYGVQALGGASAKVNADSIGWLYNPVANQTLVYVNATVGALSQTSGKLMEVILPGDIPLAAANLIG